MHSIKFLVAFLTLLILSTSCGPSEYLPKFEKIELVKMDSLILINSQIKIDSLFSTRIENTKPKPIKCVKILPFFTIDVLSTETISPTFVEKEAKPIIGKDAILVNMIYPEISKRAGVWGNVLVQFNVDTAGKTKNIRINKGIGGGCDEETLKAIERSLFVPAEINNMKIESSLLITFQFQKKMQETTVKVEPNPYEIPVRPVEKNFRTH